MKDYDLVVVGAGIVGLAHAVHAARAGLKVAVFDREPVANGASVRNFGMLALVAQAPGSQYDSARRALKCWQDISRDAGVALHQTGCLFLARAPEEISVMEECARTQVDSGREFELLTKKQLPDFVPNLKQEALIGGLWSPDVWKVDQRSALTKITDWLAREHGVTFHFSTEVYAINGGVVETSAGAVRARHTILCAGDEFDTLFPEVFRAAEISRCRLQMMRTTPQPNGWKLGPFLLGGLSIPRYEIFATCPSLPALKDYQQRHFSAHLQHGIHLVACQESDGSITIGDSHAYDCDKDGHRSEEIDQLLLDELSELINLPDPNIAERWLGHYAYLPSGETLVQSVAQGATAVTVTNGQGMTHAFSLAEDVIRDLFG